MFSNSKDFQLIQHQVEQIRNLLVKNRQTLALAESCTGGLLSTWLTEWPGASDFFLGSLVCYTHMSKQKFLQIPEELLREKGAVNAEVSRLMTQNIIETWGSNWALSVTGVAGPGKNPKDPPVGTVFFGLSGPFGEKVEQILLEKRNRQDIRHQSALFALDFLCSGIKMGSLKKEEDKNE